ncbi:electron transport complex subunit RsxC [Clostridium sp. YIM B02551]|uniref:electron transport complex subunit RsxC n=1 Tax=Clostridium sp. YIM B02551 TaxID=2910679 RepID=UPI001EE9B81C|nr:electron transport complex subunit RsxC [Clostridium sp. YIM B02551]
MLKLFKGGIHPKDNKIYSQDKSIEKAPIPNKVVIPVRQHIGAPCSVMVERGEEVKKGQVIAYSEAFVSSPIHSTVSGRVIEIADYPHGVFGKCLSIVIESDGKDEWAEGIPIKRDWESLDVEEIKSIIRGAGIVGMGGATFPTHVKLSPPKDKVVDTLILNGAECEPYLTADYRMMIEYPEDILIGTRITMKVLNVSKAFVAIEDNKPEAIRVMKDIFKGTEVKVIALPTRYPQGGEKMLIKAVTGLEVPSGGLPADVGVVVQNTGTIKAISDAVVQGIPLIERVTTITGGAIEEPKNLLLRIGTTFQEAIDICGGLREVPEKIIMGGPMMGMAQYSTNIPIIKGTSGILALTKSEINMNSESNCIRCGSCIEACPMGLNPSMLSILGERKFYEEAKSDYNLLDCIECGCCTYVCPAKRNIVQYIKFSKSQNALKAAK